jgi:hypothetical protein
MYCVHSKKDMGNGLGEKSYFFDIAKIIAPTRPTMSMKGTAIFGNSGTCVGSVVPGTIPFSARLWLHPAETCT